MRAEGGVFCIYCVEGQLGPQDMVVDDKFIKWYNNKPHRREICRYEREDTDVVHKTSGIFGQSGDGERAENERAVSFGNGHDAGGARQAPYGKADPEEDKLAEILGFPILAQSGYDTDAYQSVVHCMTPFSDTRNLDTIMDFIDAYIDAKEALDAE